MGVAISNKFDYKFKLVLVGDAEVGKSQLIQRLMEEKFSESYISTVGIDHNIKDLTIDEKIVKLEIWDIESSERFRANKTSYYREAHAILLAFDLSKSLNNIDNLNKHIKEIRRANSNGKIFLVGTKSDMKLAALDDTQINSYVEENKLECYFETSAKDNRGVNELFEGVADKLMAARPAPEPHNVGTKSDIKSPALNDEGGENESFKFVAKNLTKTGKSAPETQLSNNESGKNPSSPSFLRRHIGKILVGAVFLGAIATLAVFTGGLALTLLPLAKGLIVAGAALVGVVGGVIVGRRKDKQDQEAKGAQPGNQSYMTMLDQGVLCTQNTQDEYQASSCAKIAKPSEAKATQEQNKESTMTLPEDKQKHLSGGSPPAKHGIGPGNKA